MDQARSTMAAVALSAATLAASVFGPKLGAPDPAVMVTIMFASLTSSIAGFAFSAICGGILFHLLDDHVRIVQIMIAVSIANQLVMVWSLREEIRWRALAVFVAGGMFGLPIGAWILLHADPRAHQQAMGVLLLAYGGWLMFGKDTAVRCEHPALNAVIGFAGGVTASAAALPSVPLTIWCRLKGWEKATQRALYQPFILAMQVAALGMISLLEQPRASHFTAADLICIPAGLFGTHVGMGCYRGLSTRQFTVAANILLILSGLSLVL